MSNFETICWIVTFSIVSFAAGCSVSSGILKDGAIAHHAAHYDGQTGKFVWNDEVKP